MIARRSSALLKRWAMRVPRTIAAGLLRKVSSVSAVHAIPEPLRAAEYLKPSTLRPFGDDTQQMRSDAVSRCLELMARTAALLKQLLTWCSLLRQSRRGVA